MPHRLIAILLMLSLSYQSFVKLGIVIWYEYNKDYIAKNLCENRAAPEKKCCGKCYLNKQLNKVEKSGKDNSTIPEKWNIGEILVFTIPSFIVIPFVATELTETIPLQDQVYEPIGVSRNIFHPPSYC